VIIRKAFLNGTPFFFKSFAFGILSRMVSCDKIKRDRTSVASPVPFEIPTRLFVGRIPRTGFAGCCGRPSRVALSATVLMAFSIIHILLKHLDE